VIAQLAAKLGVKVFVAKHKNGVNGEYGHYQSPDNFTVNYRSDFILPRKLKLQLESIIRAGGSFILINEAHYNPDILAHEVGHHLVRLAELREVELPAFTAKLKRIARRLRYTEHEVSCADEFYAETVGRHLVGFPLPPGLNEVAVTVCSAAGFMVSYRWRKAGLRVAYRWQKAARSLNRQHRRPLTEVAK
jgi:hypothetical protein